jgi:membrane-associated phospholipid phosphatase
LPAIVIFASTLVKRAFATAYVMICIVGFLLYVAVPSWGPVFIVPEEFNDALTQMPLTVTVQYQLHKETLSLIRNPAGRRTIRYGGIAAFPSLHVALLTLFTLASRTISKRWFHINIGLTALMVIGTLITGYHYLVDSYVGFLIGLGAYKLSEFWIKKLTVTAAPAPA